MATLQEFKCPCCGGTVAFDSATQHMKCPYCDTEFDVEAFLSDMGEAEGDDTSGMTWDTAAGSSWEEGETENMLIYSCQSCGGEVIADETLGSTSCPYCGNNIVMAGQFSGALRPDLIIPFQLDKNAAIASLQKHYEGKRLLPAVFKAQNHLEEIKGVYVPVWLYDADASADIRYKATKIHNWSDSNYRYSKTDYYSVRRSGLLSFSSVPVDGSKKMPNDMMESLEPFDVSKAIPFQMAYLSGYLADKYDSTAQDNVERANQRVKVSTQNAFASTVTGFSSVTPISTNIQLTNGTTRYALYPVWLLTTNWNGQNYLFAMNGQTGKFVGNLPVDKAAARTWLWGLTFAIGGIAYVIFLLFLWIS